jgi:release factor glutamine methyltransferase
MPTTPTDSPKVDTLLRRAEKELMEAGIEEARLNAEVLLARVLGLPRGQLRASLPTGVSEGDFGRFHAMVRRRCSREPLQYILGDVEFMGLTLAVSPAVLIPRPETEHLVEEAVRFLTASPLPGPEVLDVGTGSGNIAIAVARMCSRARITAIDISEAALEVARRNLDTNGVTTVTLELRSVFSPVLDERRYDLILANPPYVSVSEFALLEPEIRLHEPRIATTDEGDGFRFVRRLASLAARTLRPGGRFMLELGFGQAEQASLILAEAGFSGVRIHEDLAGIPRVAVAPAAREM